MRMFGPLLRRVGLSPRRNMRNGKKMIWPRVTGTVEAFVPF